MRYKAEHKEASRAAILRAAGEVFRARGFAGVGVDAVAAAADMTSGAFYKHFRSKAEAFREVVRAGVERVSRRVRSAQASHPEDEAWIDDFITTYFDPEHVRAVGEGCLLPSLTPEVARSDLETRAIFGTGLLEAAEAMCARAPFANTPDGFDRALAVLALAAGGTGLARGVSDPDAAVRIAEAARKAASQVAHGDLARARPPGAWRWRPSR